jgi:hypothetical protein
MDWWCPDSILRLTLNRKPEEMARLASSKGLTQCLSRVGFKANLVLRTPRAAWPICSLSWGKYVTKRDKRYDRAKYVILKLGDLNGEDPLQA